MKSLHDKKLLMKPVECEVTQIVYTKLLECVTIERSD